jgi:ATP-dependent HslUV protease ATP-binding subunit HslU
MIQLGNIFGDMAPKKKKTKKVKVKEARKILREDEAQNLIDMDQVEDEAMENAEQNGIIFIDEIDKIASGGRMVSGADVSREGVQRDILPIVEGSVINTKYGPVKTDHILFIGAGAFSVSKPTDLIPELQGRFPIRVTLDSLTKDDFVKILTQPQNALTKQHKALLETEGVELEFTEDGIDEIATISYLMNEQTENIGARRLHTILEILLEDVSYSLPDPDASDIVIDRQYVLDKLHEKVKEVDVDKYIL